MKDYLKNNYKIVKYDKKENKNNVVKNENGNEDEKKEILNLIVFQQRRIVVYSKIFLNPFTNFIGKMKQMNTSFYKNIMQCNLILELKYIVEKIIVFIANKKETDDIEIKGEATAVTTSLCNGLHEKSKEIRDLDLKDIEDCEEIMEEEENIKREAYCYHYDKMMKYVVLSDSLKKKKQNRKIKKKIENINEENREKKEAIENMKEENKEKKKPMDNMKIEYRKKIETIDNMKKEYSEKIETIDNMKKEYREKKETIDNMKIRYKEKKETIDNMNIEYREKKKYRKRRNIKLKFDNIFEYVQKMLNLIKLEEAHEKDEIYRKTVYDVAITWKIDRNCEDKGIAYINENLLHLYYARLNIEIIFNYETNAERVIYGEIYKINEYGICVEFTQGFKNFPANNNYRYTIKPAFNVVTYNRIKSALRSLKNNKTMNNNLVRAIYGKYFAHDVGIYRPIEKNIVAVQPPNLPLLNEMQEFAIKEALSKNLCIIQGPPGTGKTVTAAAVAYNLVTYTKERILVAASSNISADELTMKIHKTGLNVIRVCGFQAQEKTKVPKTLCLHHKVSIENKTNKLTDQEILIQADVICCTCSTAGDLRIQSIPFNYVIIDEASHATEPECMIPATLCRKNLILIGDQLQLSPVVQSKKAKRKGLSISLFERLIRISHQYITLSVQYRMHPCLSKFPLQIFYDGVVHDGVTVQQRTNNECNFPWPNPNYPMFFYHISGSEEELFYGRSFLNRKEADSIVKLIVALIRSGVDYEQIGVISLYSAQSAYIQQHLSKSINTYNMGNEIKKICVANVDAFQGSEKDFILLSCVRSNSSGDIGFLRDKCRLNVAITRAKYGLIICGNEFVLSHDMYWHLLLNHFRKLNLVVT